MKRIQNFDDFVGEAFDAGDLTGVPILANAMRDEYTKSISKDILNLVNSDFGKTETWQEPYRQIFRKACLKFGGAAKSDINKTCNKPVTLQKLAEHFLDPVNGIFNQKAVDQWVTQKTKGVDPNVAAVGFGYKAGEVDRICLLFADILLKTGISAGGLKKTGTYVLEKAIPVMKRFYKLVDLERMKIFTNGRLIDPARAKELLVGGETKGPGDRISLN
jgi:hypothetical protein